MFEKKYDFRKYLETIHEKDLRDDSLVPSSEETVLNSSWTIRIPEDASDFIYNAAADLASYLFISMGLSAGIARGGFDLPRSVILTQDAALKVRRSYRLTCTADRIQIEGADERGTAMGVYHLEDVMTLRESPFIPRTEGLVKEPLFSPRMVHSAYGMDIFTAPYLKRIAHAGYDSILVYVLADKEQGVHGPCDFNGLIDMAEAAGLDVYLYSRISNKFHPDDSEAAAYYESQYGGLFQKYPKARGLILVGESCRFPSHDPNTSQTISSQGSCCFHKGGKPSPGWWPCTDYPEFLEMLKKCIHKYSPEADIVFWTYNWGYAPVELRTKLIENLPDDISVELNFAIHDNYRIWGTQERILDYSAAMPGPSHIFQEEGEATARRGLPLYAMCNTGGKTWDHGSAPYLPTPQQWGRRIEALLKARKDYGLRGLMESHHYGWYPSIISELTQQVYWSNGPDMAQALRAIAARYFSGDTADQVLEVWQSWSDALSQFATPIEDQYGPCRVGPSYPFLFEGISLRETFGMTMKFPWTAANIYEIVFPEYKVVNDPDGLDMGIRRVKAEIRHLPEVIAMWNRGADALDALLPRIPVRKHARARKMTGLARYIANTLVTTLNIKKWWLENHRLVLEENPAAAAEILDRIVRIAEDELANVRSTLPLVRADSSLGYEPSMDYVADEAHLQWKIDQLTSVLNQDIPKYRKGIETARTLLQ